MQVKFLRLRYLVASLGFASACVAASPNARPDALMQIDMNRGAVVERIMSSWSKEIPAVQLTSLKEKLMGLRADHLLAANLSGSFEGVLEVIDAREKEAATAKKLTEVLDGLDKSKALGDNNADLVYTPVTPCRLFDTRTGQASALGTVGGAIVNQSRRTISAGGACGIPTTGVRSIMFSFHSTTNNPPALGIISFMAPAAPLTALAATWTGGTWVTGTFVAPTNNSGQFDAFVGNPAAMQADLIADVVGYFAAPLATALQCTRVAGTGVDVLPNTYRNVSSGVASCSAGYSMVSLGFSAGSDVLHADSNVLGPNLYVRNVSSSTQTVPPYSHCCRVPGR